jgi:hypothetical protein
MTPSTMQDLITQGVTDQTQLVTDQQTITADQAKLETDNTGLTTDQNKAIADTATFDTAVAQTGPIIGLDPSGTSGTIYAAPGVVLQAGVSYPLASSVPLPAPPQPPAVVPSS